MPVGTSGAIKSQHLSILADSSIWNREWSCRDTFAWQQHVHF